MFTRVSILFFFLAGCAAPKPLTTGVEPSVAAIQADINYLSSDSLEGRRTGTKGEAMAAAYLATRFQNTGLQPKGTNGFYQPFEVAREKVMGRNTALSLNGTALLPEKDFFPLPFSANGTLNATPLIALMERGEPWFFDLAETLAAQKANPHFDLLPFIRTKAKDAAAKGANAFVVYNSSKAADGLQFSASAKEETLSIPVVYISKEAAKKYLSDASAAVAVSIKMKQEEVVRSGTNVVAYLDYGAANTVVIGAHYDHLGYGEDNNSRHTGAVAQIHNGADDNASGTAALLELARLLKAAPLKANNYLFVAFSGEELGLFGSKHFVQHSAVPFGNISFMINMDMVGRLADTAAVLTVGGFGTSPLWADLYNRKGSDALYAAATYRFDSSGTGPSDHTSFYRQNIPVLFYFTGLHTDYHKPTDDADKINVRGEAAVVKHIYSLLSAVDKSGIKPQFTKTREAQMTTTARFSVTLGIMPDYTYTGAGVRADGVTEGRPAQKAGLKSGDIITDIGDNKIATMENYMQTLGRYKKGDKTTVRYLRNGQPVVAPLEF